MGTRRRGGETSPELSERQRYWLKHLRAADGKGEPLKHYAARLGLSEHSLYEAKRRLRELGVIAPAARRRAGSSGSARFARVAVSDGSVASAPSRSSNQAYWSADNCRRSQFCNNSEGVVTMIPRAELLDRKLG